jgi:hypothetical protein
VHKFAVCILDLTNKAGVRTYSLRPYTYVVRKVDLRGKYGFLKTNI